MDFISPSSRKYRLIGNRIISTQKVRYVDPGTKGGEVSGPHNLSQEGSCWIYPQAGVLGESQVRDSAVVGGTSVLNNYSIAADESIITGNSFVIDGDIRGQSTVADTHLNSTVLRDVSISSSIAIGSDISSSFIRGCTIFNSSVTEVSINNCYLYDTLIEDHRDFISVCTVNGYHFVVYRSSRTTGCSCSYKGIGKEVAGNYGIVKEASDLETLLNFDKEGTSQQKGVTHQKNRVGEYIEAIEIAKKMIMQWRDTNPKDPSIDKYYRVNPEDAGTSELFSLPAPTAY